MSLVVLANQSTEEESLHEGQNGVLGSLPESPQPLRPTEVVPLNKHVDLQLETEAKNLF